MAETETALERARRLRAEKLTSLLALIQGT